MPFVPFTMHVFYSVCLFSYGVTSNAILATITRAHVLAKMKESDGSFNLDRFDVRFHQGITKTLIMFEPAMLLPNYGITNPLNQVMSLFGRNETNLRTHRCTWKLKPMHKCQVA